ncbi:phosphoribosylglycinamide formyltransferase 2 [Mycobacterium lacus]|uniref:Phosphoribosylglycinamide formyltransferase 2 n=1 Tax=Mycobacterium lacus TaxID=169765 RepID=A0A7I7NRQ9_9MYCO|nr:phosphoribosylglycinamide formyltransferase 2 [Mycobacterium lacus]
MVLLGSDALGRELAIALRRLGAEVIAVDGRAAAPTHGVADQSLAVSMTDADGLAALIRRLQPDFVATATDAVSPDAIDALEACGDNGFTELVPSARGVRLAADREGLRRLAADQLGLPTAPFWFVGSLGELEAVAAHAGFPLLVTPVAGEPGRRHSVVAGPDDVERAWQRAVGPDTGGANRRLLAETKVEIEFFVTLIVVRTEGPDGPVIEFCAPIGHGAADADEPESWQPQRLTTSAMDAAKSIAARIVKALGGRGVFSVELMVNGDEVYFAGVTPRPQHSAWVTVRSQRLSVFELQARAILGLAVDTMMISPGASRVISARGAPTADALTKALAVPESDVRVFGRGPGVALATAPDVGTARDRARRVAAALRGRN